MIRAILTFPILILALYGMGEWLRAKLLGDEPYSTGRIGRALGFGILAHALIMTFLGFAHFLTLPVTGIVTALPFLIFAPVWLRDLRLIFSRKNLRPSTPFTVSEIVILSILILIVLIRGFNSLAPNISWDATSHHYLIPSEWIKAGFISDIPSISFSYYPSLVEMGIAGTMGLGTDFLSNLYGWLYGILAILLLIGIPMRHFSDASGLARLGGLFGALLFMLFPGNGVQMMGGYVDLPLACWTLLSLDLILELKHSPRISVLISAALFAGAVLATKHLGILPFAGLLILLIWILFREVKSPALLPYKFLLPVLFIFVALLIPLPWYIRAIAITGNPLYPFGFFGLPTPAHPPFSPSSWLRLDYKRSIPGFISYWAHLATSYSVGHALGRNYSVLILLSFPFLYFVRNLKSLGRIIVALAILSVPVIYVLFPIETRYHIPFIAPIALSFGLLVPQLYRETRQNEFSISFFLLVFIPAGLYLTQRESANIYTIDALIAVSAIISILIFSAGKTKNLLHAALILLCLFSFAVDIIPDIQETGKRYKVVLNQEPEDKYLLRESPFNYGTIHYINNNMDWKNMRILTLEPRLYRLKADWVTWYGLDIPIVPANPQENIWVKLRGGFNYLLLGDDILLKALMYFNIVHMDGWDIAGASPSDLIHYLEEHPDEREVRFRLEDLWTNFMGDPFTDRSRHFTQYWLPRELSKELYPAEVIDGVTWYTADRLDILGNPEELNQYTVIRDFRDMVRDGVLNVVYTDELTFLFYVTIAPWAENYEDVQLETEQPWMSGE